MFLNDLDDRWAEARRRAQITTGLLEETGRAVKTHRGVKAEFHRLIRDDARFDPPLRDFLGAAYDLKTAADYLTGSSGYVSIEDAS